MSSLTQKSEVFRSLTLIDKSVCTPLGEKKKKNSLFTCLLIVDVHAKHERLEVKYILISLH